MLLGYVGSIPAAGPLAILIVTAALERDRPRAVRLAVGGALAEGIWALVALLGVERLLASAPWALLAVQAIGAVVLVLLGASMARARPATARTGDSPAHAVVGFVFVATNPGFLVVWAGFASMLASFGRVGHAVPTALGAVLGIVLWFLTLFAIVERARGRFSEGALSRVTRALGVVVIGFGVLVALRLWRSL